MSSKSVLYFACVLCLSAILAGECAFADEPLSQVLVDKSHLQVTNLGGLLTGVYIIYAGVQEFKKGGDDAMRGASSLATGLSSALGAVAITTAHAAEPDPVKLTEQSPQYKKLVAAIGAEKARDVLLDMAAGFSQQDLLKKYGAIEGVTVVAVNNAPVTGVKSVPEAALSASRISSAASAASIH